MKLIVRRPGPEGRFAKEWKYFQNKRRLDNTLHRCAIQVYDAIDVETGRISHEGIGLESGRTELHVVARESDMHLAFVYHRRLTVIPPKKLQAIFEADPQAIPSIFEYAQGIEEYECSHGLAVHVLEEVLQEIGFQVLEARQVGHVNALPPTLAVSHELFAVRVGTMPSGQYKEPDEEISHVKFFRPEDVRKSIASTICGLTNAALWKIRSWGLDEEPNGSFWHEVAGRL